MSSDDLVFLAKGLKKGWNKEKLEEKNRVPHLKIIDMLLDWGISISKGTVCNILNNCDESFSEDLKSARDAAIKKSSLKKP